MRRGSVPVTAKVVDRLIELSAKADALQELQRSGLGSANPAVIDKAKLRAPLAADLSALTKISRQAA
ncbi:MAG: hypothetical protein ABJC74_14290 [Gemmatimonadota bacterium]